ncbi:MAG: DNA-processing protein DprA, partial [Actinobacteria bacterium]|nr:DNA-processing protein DprA [Actinomycetota bacterium]
LRPRRWCFPARNRIIAALARLTVVVEGSERSGSLITARIARELGRDVAAVPGRATAPLAAGANALIRDGAHLLVDAQGALDLLFGVGARSAAAPPVTAGATLSPALRAVLAAVHDGRDTVPELTAAGHAADSLLGALTELELSGLVRRAPGGRYLPAA